MSFDYERKKLTRETIKFIRDISGITLVELAQILGIKEQTAWLINSDKNERVNLSVKKLGILLKLKEEIENYIKTGYLTGWLDEQFNKINKSEVIKRFKVLRDLVGKEEELEYKKIKYAKKQEEED